MKSSWIKNYLYASDTNKLCIETTSGNKYTYCEVPPVIADAFMSSSSLGTFHNQQLRGKYNSIKG